MNLTLFMACLKAYTRRTPFKPFVIEFVSGDRITVRHPEAITIRGEAIQLTTPDGGHQVFESGSVSRYLDLPPPRDPPSI